MNAMPKCSRGVQAQRTDVHTEGRLRAPFPYYGGKGRWADTINERLGTVGVYVETHGGTFAVGLSRPPAPREVMTDTNAWVCNFFRSLRGDYEQTAYWADWPTLHQDLTARHRWLLRWGDEHRERMSEDPDWYDAKAAGWWVWGISSWIGHGWCDGVHGHENRQPEVMIARACSIQRTTLPVEDKRPYAGGTNGQGRGVQPQRVEDKRPRVNERGGQGVQQQRVSVPAGAEGYDRAPRVHQSFTGQGVQIQRPVADGEILTGERLRPWFRALAQRLSRVIVLNRSWESAVTDSVLQQTPSSPKPTVGIFMDPPYKTTGGRSTGLYVGDRAGASDDVATASYEWAVAHGDRYRIAYACHLDDFPVPEGWTMEYRGFSGHRDEKKKAESLDCVMFSPACVGQGRLF